MLLTVTTPEKSKKLELLITLNQILKYVQKAEGNPI